MKISSWIQGPAIFWAGLNDRERRLVGIAGGVALLMLTALPLYMFGSKISKANTQNEEIAQVLQDIAETRSILDARREAREASDARYDRAPPALRAFVSNLASEAGIELRNVTPQPEKVANGFTRQHLRAKVRNQGLESIANLMSAVDNSNFPIATSRMKLEHPRAGDRYNLTLDVMSYTREGARRSPTESAGSADEGESETERAGPPDPS